MKRFNIWKYDSQVKNSTGGWQFIEVLSSISEDLAVWRAKQRYGLSGIYKAYEAL